jgi:hypothetical protein
MQFAKMRVLRFLFFCHAVLLLVYGAAFITRLVADAIGYATLTSDSQEAKGLVVHLVNWLLSIDATALVFMCTIGSVASFFAIYRLSQLTPETAQAYEQIGIKGLHFGEYDDLRLGLFEKPNHWSLTIIAGDEYQFIRNKFGHHMAIIISGIRVSNLSKSHERMLDVQLILKSPNSLTGTISLCPSNNWDITLTSYDNCLLLPYVARAGSSLCGAVKFEIPPELYGELNVNYAECFHPQMAKLAFRESLSAVTKKIVFGEEFDALTDDTRLKWSKGSTRGHLSHSSIATETQP